MIFQSGRLLWGFRPPPTEWEPDRRSEDGQDVQNKLPVFHLYFRYRYRVGRFHLFLFEEVYRGFNSFNILNSN